MSDESRIVRLSEKYRLLFEIEKYKDVRYIVVKGGRAGGKSFGIASFLLYLNQKEPRSTLITRYTMSSSGDSIVAEIDDKLDRFNCVDDWTPNRKESTLLCKNGAKMLFRGIIGSRGNQTAKLKSLAGADTWWCDEANEMSERDYDTIDLSIRSTNHRNFVIISYNPTNEGCWTYRKFFKGKYNGRDVPDDFCGVIGNTMYLHVTYLDNLGHLDDGFLKEAESCSLANPKRYEHVFLGYYQKGNEMGFMYEWVRRYSVATIKRNELNVYIVVDPASGKTKRKEEDFTVMSVWGLGTDNNYYLLDGVRSKMSLQDKWRTLKQLHYKWRPLKVGYEQYGMQADIQHFKHMMEQEHYRFNIKELGGVIAKKDRIDQMIPAHEVGRFYYPMDRELLFRDHENTAKDYVLEFLTEEYMTYPLCLNRSGFHDDMLDCHARIMDVQLGATFPKLDLLEVKDEQKAWDPHGY